MRTLHNRGDTIVEVMMALAVTSFLVVIAYSASNQAIRGSQDSQDREQGVQIAESQAEALRLLPSVASAPGTFCMDMTASPPVSSVPTGAVPVDVDSETNVTLANYGPVCSQGIYHVSIIHPAAPSINVFTVRVRWQRASGNGNDEVAVTYTVF